MTRKFEFEILAEKDWNIRQNEPVKISIEIYDNRNVISAHVFRKIVREIGFVEAKFADLELFAAIDAHRTEKLCK